MPNLDGTSSRGKDPRTGRGLGQGNGNRGQGGTKRCTCPECGYTMEAQRGIPCTKVECPKCKTMMKGEQCT